MKSPIGIPDSSPKQLSFRTGGGEDRHRVPDAGGGPSQEGGSDRPGGGPYHAQAGGRPCVCAGPLLHPVCER